MAVTRQVRQIRTGRAGRGNASRRLAARTPRSIRVHSAPTTLLTASLDELGELIAQNPRRLDELFGGLEAPDARTKYGCLKLLRTLSERRPELLSAKLDRFIHLLESAETILHWGAILIIGNLAAVDSRGEVDRILDKYLEPIRGSVMITAANTMTGAAKIAKAKPQCASRIAAAVMRCERATYATPECRNIALGHAIKALDAFYQCVPDQKQVVEFVRRQLENPRNATRHKAAKFLKQHEIG